MLRLSIKIRRIVRLLRASLAADGLYALYTRHLNPANLLVTVLLAALMWPVLAQAEPAKPAAPVPAPPASDTSSIPSALAVGPAIIERAGNPGEQVLASVRVSNITKAALPVNSTFRDLVPMEDILPAADKKLFNASKWFKADPAEFILKPGETKSVSVKITIPKSASPGGHYATLYFQPLVSTHLLTPGTAYLNARVGVLSFLTVRGEIREKATVTEIGGGTVRQSGPIEVVLPIRNDGNVHLLPQGKVTFYDWHGNRAGSAKLPNGILLPGTVREYRVKWGDRWTLGYFTARADIYYGTGNAGHSVAGTRIVVVPWMALAILFTSLVLLAIFIIRTHSRWGEAVRVLRGQSRRYGKIYNRKDRG